MQIYWIDNARFWLETFVIAKHLMVYLGTLYRWDTWWQACWPVLRAPHLPVCARRARTRA